MSKRKNRDVNYEYARRGLYDKDIALDNFVENMLIKCRQMFDWQGLPNTIPQRNLENYLTENGSCIFAEHNGEYYVFIGGAGGTPNVYYEPTIYTVANPALKLSKMYEIDKDCVFMRNDSKMRGLLPTLSKYAVLVNDCEITLNMIANVLRAQYIITANDNRTLEGANLFIKKLTDGDFSAIGSNAFLDSIKISDLSSANSVIHDMIELTQYLKASAYNEIGLDANYNMKRERLTENEVDLNQSILIPLAQDMLAQRKIACEKINEMYGLNVSVELASVWKMQVELAEQAIEQAEQSKDLGGNEYGGNIDNGDNGDNGGIGGAGDDGDIRKDASAIETDNGNNDSGNNDSGNDIGGKEDDGRIAEIDGKLESADDTERDIGNNEVDNASSGNADDGASGNDSGNDDGNGNASGRDDDSGVDGADGNGNGNADSGANDTDSGGNDDASGNGGNGGANGDGNIVINVITDAPTDITVGEGEGASDE